MDGIDNVKFQTSYFLILVYIGISSYIRFKSNIKTQNVEQHFKI